MAMLSGMTGFARVEGATGGWVWSWEARSVNSRGLELRLRLPPGMDGMEPALREAARERLSRGGIQANLTLRRDEAATAPAIDMARLMSFVEAGRPLVEAGLAAPPALDGLLQLPGVLKGGEEIGEEEAAARAAAIFASFGAVLDGLEAARREEGAALLALLNTVLDEIAALRDLAAGCAAARPDAIRQRLKAKIDDLLEQGLPEERLVQEAALLAVKADIREELDRLSTHLDAAHALLAAGSPAGRKLDFLSQEFNREVNTLCSKSGDSELTRIGLAMKAAVEQFREQVQNVE